jgi:hypothetical protein
LLFKDRFSLIAGGSCSKMGRHSCCYKQKLRKGLWSPEEDEKLLRHITKYGHGCWSSVPKQAGNFVCLSLKLTSLSALFRKKGEFIMVHLHMMNWQVCRGVGRAAD